VSALLDIFFRYKNSMKYSKIIATGSALPKHKMLNADLPAVLETSDEWIVSRTGITQRFIAGEGELTSDLAAEAARKALERAGLKSVDLIVLATTTPDKTFPSTATILQRKLGIHSGFAFDVQAVCSGFVYALAVADNFIKAGQAKTALVIGAETLTKILDWKDRGTCVLFGDGAGAVVLQATNEAGIIATKLHSDGAFEDELYVDGGVSLTQTAGLLRMNGKEVFKHAVEKMSNSIVEIVEQNDFYLTDIDWVVPHQANKRIMDAIAKRLELPAEKVIETVSIHANTSAATIPLALDVSWDKFKKGDLIALTALGAGFTWGSALLRV
jgi:3-oxoacyl-[acyl-carrier-protein] synthase-3